MNHLCNNCGGEYDYRNGRWVCRACGAFKPEEISNEEVTLLYTAYQNLRLAKFDESEQEFDDIIQKFPQNPNAYWGRLMAKYGIKYERDFDGRMIPTCYATSIESVITASDYKKALQYADADTREYYRQQAEYIERVRREWVEKASREKPYDIFICYKDSDLEHGIDRTEDSVAAQDLYIHLTNKGYRVFYSHESLRDKVGEKYEPYIFSALSTAKVMLVYGSKPEYITSTWLKNEWTRYEKRIKAGEKNPNSLLVACEGFSPGDLPTELSSRQCFNAGEKSFYSDLDEKIEQIIHPNESARTVGGDVYDAPKKKSKAPVIAVVLCLLLAAVAVFFGMSGMTGGGGTSGGLSNVTNSAHNATVVVHDGELPKDTEFRVEEIQKTEELETMTSALEINHHNYKLYDMSLWSEGSALNLSGNVTVTLPLPEGISEKNAAVYYLSGARPQKISAQVSNGKVTFVTNHFSIYMIAEEIDCEHVPTSVPAVPPTCTEEGLSEGSVCSLCGKVLTEQTVVPPEHNLSALDCEHGQYCLDCGEVISTPTGHDYVVSDKTNPTCTEQGTTVYSCKYCKQTYTEYTDALGHNPGAEATCTTSQSCLTCGSRLAPAKGHSSDSPATCTEAEICTVCNAEITPATGHDYGISVVDPTCTENGYRVHFCDDCGDRQEEVIPPVGHMLRADATCTESAYCQVCGELVESKNGHIPGVGPTCTDPQCCLVCGEVLADAVGHGYEATVTAPTCTEQGSTTYTCSACGDSYVSDYLPALGHTPGEGATCTEPSACAVCGEIMEIENGHIPGAGATCTTPQSCVVCGTELAPAHGHTPNGEATCTEAQICTECHAELAPARGHTPGAEATCMNPQICETCGEVLAPIKDHAYVPTVVDPTCTESGYTQYTCVCGQSYTDTASYTNPLGHTPSEGASCTEPCYCAVCGELMTSAGGHIPGAGATCSTPQTCVVCGTELAPVTDHIYYGEITAPTCTEGGYTTYQCHYCDESYVDDRTDPLGHTPEEGASCDESCYCAVCGTLISEAGEHIPGPEATCTAPQTCTICGEVLKETVNHSLWVSVPNENFTVTNDTLYPFFVENGVLVSSNHDGLSASSYIITATRAFTLELEYAVSSEDGYDTLVIRRNDGELVSVSGTVSWTALTVDMQEGDTVTVSFNKDSSGDGGADCAYVKLPIGKTVEATEDVLSETPALCLIDICCTVCGETLIPSRGGHDEIPGTELPPTETSDGHTAGTLCSVCGEILSEQEILHATGTPGLSYSNSADGTATLVGIGSATATEIYIPHYYNGMPVTAIAEEAFAEQSQITRIVIPDSVTSIGIRAFYACTGLTEMTVPASVIELGTQVFFHCTNLKTLYYNSVYADFNNPVIQQSEITKVVFGGEYVCPYILYEARKVTEIVVEDSVTVIDVQAFDGCENLASVTIGSGVTTIRDWAFGGCKSLTEIVIPDSVTLIDSNAFRSCTSLASVTLGSGLKTIDDEAFRDCTALAKITLPANLELINDLAFYGCTSLAEITVSGSVMTIGASAFYGCTSLASVTLEKGIGIIEDNVFRDCMSLTEITIPNSVSSLGACVFMDCTSLKSAVLSDGLPTIPSQTFYGCTSLTSVTIPDSIMKIDSEAFFSCSSLASIEIPDSVEIIGSVAFGSCTKLVEIINHSSLTMTPGSGDHGYIAYYAKEVHSGESKLFALGDFVFYPLDSTYILVAYTGTATDVVLPDAVNGSTYGIGAHAFSDRGDITSVVIPNGVTEIGENAFSGCTGLVSMQIPFVGASADATEASTSTLFGYLFGTKYVEGTTETSQNYVNMVGGYFSYYIPDSLTTVTVTGGKLLHGAFYNCSKLTTVTLGADVTSIGEKAFYGCTSLVSVTVEGSPSEIGDYAFYGCERLTGFVIPDGVTAIGKGAFTLCKGLTEITVPDSVETVGEGAFSGCAGLTQMTLPFIGGSKSAAESDETTVLGYIFGTDGYEGCESTNQNIYKIYCIPTSLTTVTVTGGNILQYAFYNCRNLKTVVLPEDLTAIGRYAFGGCTALESIDIPDSVTAIEEGAFSSCTSLASVKLSSELQEIGEEAFYRCEALTEITVPDKVTAIGNYAFAECALLANVTLGTGLCSIGDFAFTGCPSLSEITIPDGVTAMGGNVFEGCTSLASITLPFVGNSPEGDISTQFSYIFGSTVPESMRTVKVTGTVIPSKAFRYCGMLTEIVLSEGTGSIGDYAFAECTGLTKMEIPASVSTIGIYAFYGCTGLTAINLPEHLETLENSVFAGCTGLTEITIPDSVSEIGPYAFLDCTALASVTLGEGVQKIGDQAFYRCISLTEIMIPDSVTEIGTYAFGGCTGLTNAVIGNGVKSIGTQAFDGCVKLAEITIPDSVETVGYAAFSGCSGLRTMTVPFVGASAGDTEASADYLFGYIFGANSFDGATGISQEHAPYASYHYYIPNSLTSVTVTGGKLRYGAFSNYTWLESVTLEEGITEIGEKAFYDCSALASAAIPESVTKIGNAAFAGCETLTEITVSGSVTKIGDSAFSGCSALENITVSEGVQTIGSNAFSGCKALTEIIIPDSVTSIGEGALSGCIALESLTIPFVGASKDASTEAVTTVFGHIFGSGYSYVGGTSISQNYAPSSYQYFCFPDSLRSVTVTGGKLLYGAFHSCSMLTSITLGEGVTYVAGNAFDACTSLESIRYGGTKEQWRSIASATQWSYDITCSDGTISKDSMLV